MQHTQVTLRQNMIRQPLSLLYAYAGRFADARAAITVVQSIQQGAGGRFESAMSGMSKEISKCLPGTPTQLCGSCGKVVTG